MFTITLSNFCLYNTRSTSGRENPFLIEGHLDFYIILRRPYGIIEQVYHTNFFVATAGAADRPLMSDGSDDDGGTKVAVLGISYRIPPIYLRASKNRPIRVSQNFLCIALSIQTI